MTTPDIRESAKPVVTNLRDVYKKLAITEANVELLAKMVKSSIGTNDVRNFVCNQSGLRRVNKSLDKKSIKRLMRKKLDDACAVAARLKRLKISLKKQLYKSESGGKDVVRECEKIFKKEKAQQRDKNVKKFEWCVRKQERVDIETKAPKEVIEYIKE